MSFPLKGLLVQTRGKPLEGSHVSTICNKLLQAFVDYRVGLKTEHFDSFRRILSKKFKKQINPPQMNAFIILLLC